MENSILRRHKRIVDIAVIGLFAAIISVLSILPLPIVIMGVPATLQTFAIALTGMTLGRRRGVGAIVIYILIGMVGLPVFSAGRTSFEALLGLTGGFIWGFIPMVYLCGKSNFAINLAGLLICHICGIVQFVLVTDMGIKAALLTVSLPFLIKDIIMVSIAYMVSKKIKKTGILHK